MSDDSGWVLLLVVLAFVLSFKLFALAFILYLIWAATRK